MTRTALLLALVPFALVACKEDPSGPTTSASQPTGATDPDTPSQGNFIVKQECGA